MGDATAEHAGKGAAALRQRTAGQHRGADQKRLTNIPGLYTPIWWYASFPNHYAGEGDKATSEFGKFITDHEIAEFIKALKEVKADESALKLQNEFYDRVDNLGSSKQ